MREQDPGQGFGGQGLGRRRRGGSGGCGPGHGGRGRGRGVLLEPAVLASLVSQSAHGYDLRKTVEEMTDGFVCVDPGGIYRLLRQLEQDGFVESSGRRVSSAHSAASTRSRVTVASCSRSGARTYDYANAPFDR